MSNDSQPQGLYAAISPEEAVRRVALARNAIISECQKVIVGQKDLIELLLIALFARGHCLLVGSPGAGRSLTLSTLAKVLHLKFNHVQLSPDMTLGDLAGEEVADQGQHDGPQTTRIIRGPVFSGMLVADEIDRAMPKIQSSLLHTMHTGQVRVAGRTYELQPPYMFAVTQNEVDRIAEHPLREPQLDRFMMSFHLAYPTDEEERAIVQRHAQSQHVDLRIVLRTRDILWIQDLVRQIPVTQHIIDYAVDLARATRPGERGGPGFVNDWIAWGAGPRASEQLVIAARARALIKGRHLVHAADVRAVARAVLRHRVILSRQGEERGITVDQVIEKLIRVVKERSYGEPQQPPELITVRPNPMAAVSPQFAPQPATQSSPTLVPGAVSPLMQQPGSGQAVPTAVPLGAEMSLQQPTPATQNPLPNQPQFSSEPDIPVAQNQWPPGTHPNARNQ